MLCNYHLNTVRQLSEQLELQQVNQNKLTSDLYIKINQLTEVQTSRLQRKQDFFQTPEPLVFYIQWWNSSRGVQ